MGEEAKPKARWREKWREKHRVRAERRSRVDPHKVKDAVRRNKGDAERFGPGM